MTQTRRRVPGWLFVLCVLSLVCCSFRATPAAAATATRTAQGWAVTEDTLPNGLKVLILEDHRAPAVTLQVWYKVGSRNERLGLTGISHLLEHLMFRGTPKYGPGQFSKLVQSTGGSEDRKSTRLNSSHRT